MDSNEFIDNGEIIDSINEAKKLVKNKAEIDRILAKARQYKGLTHRESAVLLEIDDDETLEKMYKTAR
jgi:2-iminoacetate synthase